MSTYMIVALDTEDRDVFKSYQRAVSKTFEIVISRGTESAPGADVMFVEGS